MAASMASCGADAPSRPAGRRPMQFQARDAARLCSVDASLLSLPGAASGPSAGPALCSGNKRRTASHCASHCATPPQSMKPQDLRHVNTAFFTINGIISPVVLAGVLLGIYI